MPSFNSFLRGGGGGGGGGALGFTLEENSASITVSGGGASVGAAAIYFSAQPSDGDTITIAGVTYTFKDPFVDADCNVLIGTTLASTIHNLINAINGGAGRGTLYGTACVANPNVVANTGTGTAIHLESPVGGIVSDPPVVPPILGKLPSQLTSPPVMDGWWRADQLRALVRGEVDLHAWGSLVKGPLSGWTGGNAFESIGNEEPKPITGGDSDFNGHQVIEFVVADSARIVTNEGTGMAIPLHIFMVVKELAFSANRFWLDGLSAVNQLSLSTQTSGALVQRNSANTAYVNGVSIPAPGTVFVVDGLWDGLTTSFLRVNAGAKSTGSPAGSGPLGITLGNSQNGANNGNVRIAEVVRFDGELTGSDLADLFSYFKERYNIAALP